MLFRNDNTMKLSRYTINSYKLSNRLSILVIADNHDEFSEKWVTGLSPDVIFVVGDFVFGHKLIGRSYKESWAQHCPNSYRMLSALVKIAPVFLSLGNHECLLGEEDIEIIRELGINVLDDNYIRIRDEILVGGLTSGLVTNYNNYISENIQKVKDGVRGELHYDFYHHGESDYKLNCPEYQWLDYFEKESGFKILLSHHPEYWKLREPFLATRNIDLVISGHAHGGQIRMLGQGIYAPSQGLLPAYTKGIYEGEFGKMVVSAGMANTYRIPRLFNPPEIVEIICDIE